MKIYINIVLIMLILLIISLPVTVLYTIWFELFIGFKLMLSNLTLLSFFFFTGKLAEKCTKQTDK